MREDVLVGQNKRRRKQRREQGRWGRGGTGGSGSRSGKRLLEKLKEKGKKSCLSNGSRWGKNTVRGNSWKHKAWMGVCTASIRSHLKWSLIHPSNDQDFGFQLHVYLNQNKNRTSEASLSFVPVLAQLASVNAFLEWNHRRACDLFSGRGGCEHSLPSQLDSRSVYLCVSALRREPEGLASDASCEGNCPRLKARPVYDL